MTLKNLLWIVVLLGCGVAAFLLIQKKQTKVVVDRPALPSPQVVDPPVRPEPEPVQPEFPERSSYVGPWRTERNLKLDGVMTCDVHYLGDNKWEGTFHGTWRRMDFSYDVEWSGPPDNVKGTAVIDGAHYTWTGKITEDLFVGEFESNRYLGDFRLKREKNDNVEFTNTEGRGTTSSPQGTH